MGKSFAQIFWVDNFGTYTSVARLSTLRIVYRLAVLICLKLALLDVKASLKNAQLDDEFYIRGPPETDQLPEGFVYRLK